MIRICQAPKRFVAALNSSQSKNLLRKHQRCVTAAMLNRNEQAQFYGTSTPAAYALSIPASLKKHDLHSEHHFSTVDTEVNNVRIEECGRTVSLDLSNLHSDTLAEIELETLDLFGPRAGNWWTGKPPVFGSCPGVEADNRIYSLPQVSFAGGECTREKLQAYFDNTWTMTEVLFAALQGEEAFVRPPYHNLRHPMIFYYGHPAALYINKLRVAGLLEKPINPYYEVIFETGVDEMSWDDLSKNEMEWPSVAEVHHYRKEVYKEVTELIQNGLSEQQLANIGQDSPLWALLMGFEHERIHIETSSVLMAEMPLELLRFPEGFPSYHPGALVQPAKQPVAGKDYPVNEMVPVSSQTVNVGKPRDFPSYGWDNEYGQRSFDIPAFSASKFMISNGEFLEFVKDGGYAKREFWTESGWGWRAFRNVKWPTMWVRKGPQGHHEYDLRLLFDVVPMPWSLPVMVNFHEATAFANWKSACGSDGRNYRVMTELEHRAIRDDNERPAMSSDTPPSISSDHAAVVGGAMMMSARGYNTNLAAASMSPVNALAANSKGFHDVFGNAWEWTQDYFCALPGFQVHSHYEDFSTPCFDGQHHVIQGGSFISTGNESSVFARFHFRPHFFQHAGFRIVAQEDPHAEMVTTDLDAPGPYVGSYPFRRSQQTLQAMLQELSETADATGAAVPSIDKKPSMNSLLLKHFVQAPHDASQSPMTVFAKQIISECRDANIDLNGANILEVGCEIGGLSFQLATATSAASVIGVDHSLENIEMARTLLAGKAAECTVYGEGELSETIEIAAYPDNMKPAAMMDFRAADPMCLPAEFKAFDVVVLNDVIDTVSSPNAVLGRLGGARGLVKSGGLLVVSSAFQWKEETTPRSLWLGGILNAENGEGKSSKDALVQRLSEDFTLLRQDELPLMWRESAHSLRGKIQSVSYFRRK